VRLLAAEYAVTLDALLDAFSEYDDCAPYSDQWNSALGRIKALSNRVQDLSDRLFRATGYSPKLWRYLRSQSATRR
jgi:hypothetical protein